MNLSGATSRLSIIVGENDQVYQRPLYEAIVFAAKKYKLSGATVCKGLLSYGAGSNAHSVKVFSLSEDAPMHIQLVDYPERLKDFSDIVRKLMDKAGAGGIITMEAVEVLHYQAPA